MNTTNLINALTNNQNNAIKTDTLTIKNNAIITINDSIQLHNISLMRRAQLSSPITLKSCILLLVLLIVTVNTSQIPIIGIASFMCLVIYGYILYVDYQQYLKSKFFILFNLGANNHYYIYFDNSEFRNKVFDTITSSFGGSTNPIIIDIKDQKIEKQTIIEKEIINTNISGDKNIIGNNLNGQNTISFGDNSTINNTSNIPWNELSQEIEKIITESVYSDKINFILKKLLDASLKKQKEEFSKIVKENNKLFNSPFIKDILSGTLSNIITSILTGTFL